MTYHSDPSGEPVVGGLARPASGGVPSGPMDRTRAVANTTLGLGCLLALVAHYTGTLALPQDALVSLWAGLGLACPNIRSIGRPQGGA